MTDANEALERVRNEYTHSPAPKKPKRLPLSDIDIEPDLFQMRNLQGSLRGSEEHVRDLLDTITKSGGAKNEGDMDALLVWWTGKRWVVLDGHHRLEAFRQYAAASGRPVKVPTEVSRAATVEEALKEANAENKKARLNTMPEDKTGHAWKLVTADLILSLRDIAGASGVGKSTVSRMRSTLKELATSDAHLERLKALTWETVQDLKKRGHKGDAGGVAEDDDLYLHEQGAEWAKRLGKTFGAKLHEAPDIGALMLLSYGEETTRRILGSRFLYEIREDLEEEERGSLEEENDEDDVHSGDF